MEKLGIEKKDLLVELKSEYLKLRSLEKTASSDPLLLQKMEAVKAKINEIEGSDD